MSVRDLFVEIGMDIEDGPLAELDKKIDGIIEQFKQFDLKNIDGAIGDVEDLSNEFSDLENTIGDVADEVDKLDRSDLENLDKEVKSTDKGMNIFKKTIVGIGTALAAWGVATVVKDFTVGAIEAAASAQALGSQFEQVFGADAGEARGVVENLGEAFGMLPERIKPAYTQMTSLFKGLGLETGESMDASERAVTAVADAAAFYDKSFEDANSALNSFIKGNYEGGESIGLFANETQLASFASKELGLDWKNLGEADKQLARLTFAEKMMESAGATGQALRESESYENQLGNLKQAWQNFLAKAGTPILEQAVTVLSKLSDIVSNIDPGPFMEFVSTGFSHLSKVRDVADAVYNTIMSIVYDTGEVSDIWQNLGVPKDIADGIESFTQIFVDSFYNVKESASNIIDGAINIFDTLKSAISGVIQGVIAPLFPVAKDIIKTAFDVISPILRIGSSLFEGISGAVKFLVSEIIVPLLPLASGAIQVAWAIMKPILHSIKSAFDGIADTVEWVIEKLGAVGQALKKFDIGGKIGGVVSKVTGILPGFDVGLGRVPYDDMPALLHKDEAVLQADQADILRDAGILKGDGTNPTLDFGGTQQYSTAATIPNTNNSATMTNTFHINVQGGNTNEETAFNLKEAMEEFFADLMAINPQVREG